MDTIDRDAAIELTFEEPNYHDPLNVLTEIRDKLKALPTVKSKQVWTPCSERLPDKIGEYLITLYNDDVIIYFYDGKWFTGEYWKSYIKAWMPRPEPYQGE